MVPIGQAGLQILFQALHPGREDSPPVLLGNVPCLSGGQEEMGGIGDPVEPGLDQGPFDLGALDLEIRHLVEKAALMLPVRERGTDSGHDSGTAIRGDHPDPLRVQTSPHQLGRQVPGLLRFSRPLKESQILPLSLLRDPGGAQGRLPTHPLSAYLEVGPPRG